MSSTFDLLFRTTDPTRWGDGKGAPLNAGEVDLNFWILLQLFLELEANPASPKQIASITTDNSALTVHMDDGSTFGPFTLPVAAFTYRGNWQASTTYSKYDFVTQTGGLYLIQHAITSDTFFDPDASDLLGEVYKLVLAYPVSFDIGFYFPGLPGTGIADGASIFQYRFARQAFMNAGLPFTVGGLSVATTGDLSFPIQQNGTVIGSVDIASGQTEATFTFPDDIQFFADDILKVMKPISVDATASDLTVTFAATKGALETPSS